MTDLFGPVYAPVYDRLYGDKDYDGEVELLDRLFRRYATQPIRSVLDVGCGTGNHAVRLAAKGYRVVGLDRSAEMLAVADRKVRDCGLNLRFHQADIRNIELGETFDVALLMFAVLGYQTEEADVLGTLQTVRRHLRTNSLLMFDVWFGPAVAAQGPEERVRTIEQDGNTWVRRSSGELEAQRNLCHVAMRLTRVTGHRTPDETEERHTMRYFYPEEIDRFLNDSGFHLLRLGAFPEFDRAPDCTTWNVMAVAIATPQ